MSSITLYSGYLAGELRGACEGCLCSEPVFLAVFDEVLGAHSVLRTISPRVTLKAGSNPTPNTEYIPRLAMAMYLKNLTHKRFWLVPSRCPQLSLRIPFERPDLSKCEILWQFGWLKPGHSNPCRVPDNMLHG